MHEEEDLKKAEQIERRANAETNPPKIHRSTLFEHALCDSTITVAERITPYDKDVTCLRCIAELRRVDEEPARCGICRRPIDFVKMKQGALLPVDVHRFALWPMAEGTTPLAAKTVTLVTDEGEYAKGYLVHGEALVPEGATSGRFPHSVACHRKSRVRTGAVSLDLLLRVLALCVAGAGAFQAAISWGQKETGLFVVISVFIILLLSFALSPEEEQP